MTHPPALNRPRVVQAVLMGPMAKLEDSLANRSSIFSMTRFLTAEWGGLGWQSMSVFFACGFSFDIRLCFLRRHPESL